MNPEANEAEPKEQENQKFKTAYIKQLGSHSFLLQE